MEFKTLLSNLREEVCCSVCSNIFTDPKQLLCLHSFCLSCLQQWYRRSQFGSPGRYGRDTIKCPKCQAISKVPRSGDLKDLPTSFYLNGLIDVLAIKECKNSQITCGNCEQKCSESSYCFQCCLFYCSKCETAHNTMRSNKDHRVMALKEFQDKDYEDVLKRPVLCPELRHRNEELKYYCQNCERAVCQSCVTLNHSGHAFAHIDDAAEKQKVAIKSLIERQKRNLRAMVQSIRRLEAHCDEMERKGKSVAWEIEELANDFIKHIEVKKTEMLRNAKEQTRISIGRYKEEIDESARHAKFMESSMGQVEKLLSTCANAEVGQLGKSTETIFDRFPEAAQEKSLPELVFVENSKLLHTVQTAEIGSFNWRIPSQPAREIDSFNWSIPSQAARKTVSFDLRIPREPARQAPVPGSNIHRSRSRSEFKIQRKLFQTMRKPRS